MMPPVPAAARRSLVVAALAVGVGVLIVLAIDLSGGSGSVVSAAVLVPFLLAVLTGAAKTTTA